MWTLQAARPSARQEHHHSPEIDRAFPTCIPDRGGVGGGGGDWLRRRRRREEKERDDERHAATCGRGGVPVADFILQLTHMSCLPPMERTGITSETRSHSRHG